VSRVLRIVVRFVTGSAVMRGMRGFLGPGTVRGLVRAPVVLARDRFLWRGVLRCNRSWGNRQHPAQHVGPTGEQYPRYRR